MPILKRLRRLLRNVKGKLALGGVIIIFISGWLLLNGLLSDGKVVAESTNEEHSLQNVQYDTAIEVMNQTPVVLVLKTKYLCGVETEIIELEDMQAIESWMANQDKSWSKEVISDREVVLVREVSDDISPTCKEEAYIGLTGDGVLSLFQGPPTQNQVIETFFRIDTRLLESKLPEAELLSLRNGIRIEDVNKYLQVISTYGKYAAE